MIKTFIKNNYSIFIIKINNKMGTNTNNGCEATTKVEKQDKLADIVSDIPEGKLAISARAIGTPSDGGRIVSGEYQGEMLVLLFCPAGQTPIFGHICPDGDCAKAAASAMEASLNYKNINPDYV